MSNATATSGGNSTSINLSNGANGGFAAGSEIPYAMNGLADTNSAFTGEASSGTNRMTVVVQLVTISVSWSNPNTFRL